MAATGTRMQTSRVESPSSFVSFQFRLVSQQQKDYETPYTPGILTALQRGIDVDSGFMNPGDDSYQFLDERGHHAAQDGGAAARRRQDLHIHFVGLCHD